MNVFKGWTEEDVIQEVKSCYECIFDEESSDELKKSALAVISFAALAQGYSEEFTETAKLLVRECSEKMLVVVTTCFPPDPDACKGCGVNDDYRGIGKGAGYHIYCDNCGQDYDHPHLNWN